MWRNRYSTQDRPERSRLPFPAFQPSGRPRAGSAKRIGTRSFITAASRPKGQPPDSYPRWRCQAIAAAEREISLLREVRGLAFRVATSEETGVRVDASSRRCRPFHRPTSRRGDLASVDARTRSTRLRWPVPGPAGTVRVLVVGRPGRHERESMRAQDPEGLAGCRRHRIKADTKSQLEAAPASASRGMKLRAEGVSSGRRLRFAGLGRGAFWENAGWAGRFARWALSPGFSVAAPCDLPRCAASADPSMSFAHRFSRRSVRQGGVGESCRVGCASRLLRGRDRRRGAGQVGRAGRRAA